MSEDDRVVCRRVVLIRHGHYERVGALGDTVWGLSPLGRRQAVRVGKRIARTIESATGKFEGVYASPWPRALQTAEIVARELAQQSVKIKPYLHEVVPLIDPQSFEHPLFPVDIEPTPERDRNLAIVQLQRVRNRFFTEPRKNSIVTVFTHGNLIRFMVAKVLRLPYEAWALMDIAHCSITEIRVYQGGFEALICFNETGHLPHSLITTS